MTEGNRFLCFSLGKEDFAIPLLTVREVIGLPEITPIPQMPAHFLGVVNLRGSVISIMDLRNKLGIKPTISKETSIIILDLGKLHLGVVVDCINSVLLIEKDKVSPKPHLENSKSSEAIMGVFQNKEHLVLLLDIAKALSVEDKLLVGEKKAA